MGYSQAQKRESHDRVVAIAAARFRERGLDGVGVADLMKEAGLTHGGFYSHFASREVLVREALERAFLEDGERLARAMRRREGPVIERFLDVYLSPAHRDTPGKGCTLAAISPEAARRDSTVQALFARQLEHYVARLQPESGLSGDRILAILSGAVGALTLARAMGSGALSDQLLASARTELLKLAAAPA